MAIHIAESLCETEVPSSWLWSMHSWHIKHVFLNGVSLHDHDQTDIYKKAMIARGRLVHVGVRPYASHRQRRDHESQLKKDSLLTTEAILEASTKSCCPNNCLQPFPQGEIQAIRFELHVRGGVYGHKRCLFEVHRQKHKDPHGKEWVTLKGREVCLTAWWTIHGMSKATFYRYKEMAKSGQQADGHGNLGSKKPQA